MTAPVLQAQGHLTPDAGGAAASASGRPGWLVMWGIELAKLSAQLRVRLALAACALGPVVLVLFEKSQSSTPGDTLFGAWIHQSGFAIALFLLAFSGQWLLPILVCVVTGDVFAGEDRQRTWTLLLTRSRSRGEVFAGKVLAAFSYTVAVVVLMAASVTLSGMIFVGTQPLVSLSGAVLSSGAALHAVLVSWAAILPPTLAVAAIAMLVSVVSRNTWVGVLGPVVVYAGIGVVSGLSAIDPVRAWLPTTGFDAWHGLVRDHAYADQVQAALVVSIVWILVALLVAAVVAARRDIVDG
jgi:ABC-2 type transport system permease protein